MVLILIMVINGCSSLKNRRSASPQQASPSGGYYQDDGPGSRVLPDLASIPDAIPRAEPLHRFANRPYTVFGREYVPATTFRLYKERGMASWYGRKFDGQKTAIGERYDMYAMTAAHPTLPLPSYARVTHPRTGQSVVVRINDRGPFLSGRLIDLSYVAAAKLGILQQGTVEVEVESVDGSTRSAVNPPPLAAVVPQPSAGTATAPPMAVAAESGGFVVQLAAFSNYANAQSFIERWQNQRTRVGVEAKVREAGGWFRVYLGPFATRDEAVGISQRLRDELRLDSTVRPH